MPEIISLLSSSPTLPEAQSPPVSHLRRPETEPDILLDDLESSLFDYGNFGKPAKKRKLSPHFSCTKESICPSKTPDSLFAFLSDEGDAPDYTEQSE